MGASFCPRIVRPVAAPQLKQLVAAARNRTLFVKFASAFCSACTESRAAIDTALKRSASCLDVVELDSDVADSTADGFGVKALPTLVAIRDGKVLGKMEGAQAPEAYARFFAKHGG